METSNPYESPKSNTFTNSSETYQPRIFAVNGRIGRLRYLAFAMIISSILMIVIGILSAIFIPMLATAELSETMMILLMFLVYIPLIVVSIIFMRRRLNDLNKSGWWSILAFVPLIGIFVAIYMLFFPGTKGSNSYGLEPSANPTWVVIIGLWLPIILFVLGIVAAISIPAFQDYTVRAQQTLESNQE